MLSDSPRATWQATATKLIEFRNTLEEPLLVFVPPGMRSAAEDSLDIATFTELTLSGFAGRAVERLLTRIPEPLCARVSELLGLLREQKLVRHDDEVVEYLATVAKNGATNEAAGGALYVFGLVPDFEFFNRPSLSLGTWLSRNRNAKEALADVKQPLITRVRRLPLSSNSIQNELFGFLRERHCDDTRAWTKEIGTNDRYVQLSLNEWAFTDRPDEEGKLRLILEPLGLKEQEVDEVSGSASMPVLDLSGKDGLRVTFRSIPAPPQATVWATFRFQLLSLDGEQPTEIWESYSYKKPKGTKKATASRTIKVDELKNLPEGVYRLRANAYDQHDTLITTPERVDGEDSQSRFENESEPFFVVQQKTSVVEPEYSAVPVPSILDAWVAASAKPKNESEIILASV